MPGTVVGTTWAGSCVAARALQTAGSAAGPSGALPAGAAARACAQEAALLQGRTTQSFTTILMLKVCQSAALTGNPHNY